MRIQPHDGADGFGDLSYLCSTTPSLSCLCYLQVAVAVVVVPFFEQLLERQAQLDGYVMGQDFRAFLEEASTELGLKILPDC